MSGKRRSPPAAEIPMKSVASPQHQRGFGRGGPRHGGRPAGPAADPLDLMSNQQRQAEVAGNGAGAPPMDMGPDLGGPSLLFAMGMNVSIGGQMGPRDNRGFTPPGQAHIPGSRIGVPGVAGPVNAGPVNSGPRPGSQLGGADVAMGAGPAPRTDSAAIEMGPSNKDRFTPRGQAHIPGSGIGVIGPAGPVNTQVEDAEVAMGGGVTATVDTAGVVVTEGNVSGVGGPAPVATVQDVTQTLPNAVEINDRGPSQPIDSIDSYIEGSAVETKTDEATTLIEATVGTTLPDQANIHIDRDAWVVASTYNADVVIIGVDIFIHRDVEEQIVDTLYPPEIFQTGPVEGEIIDIDWRPPFAQIEGSEIVMTEGGYTVEMKDTTVIMYDENGKPVVRIWGDPHVDENGDGKDEWHFGNDSTFILPDGTKVCLDTKEISPGVFVIDGVDILGGKDRFHYGGGDKSGKTYDAEKWDLEHADSAKGDASAGVFALGKGNAWAKLDADGKFYDVADQSWGGYLGSHAVATDKSKPAEGVNWKQAKVADDRDLKAGAKRTGHVEKPFSKQDLKGSDAHPHAIAENPRLPAAGQIGNMGPAHPWNTVDAEINASVAVGDQMRAAVAIKSVLNHDVTGMMVHVDVAAQSIAGTYNSLAVIIDAHVYIHSSVERRVANQLTPPWMKGMEQNEQRPGTLVRPGWRPPFAQMEGSEVVITQGGYTVEMKDTTVIMYDPNGKVVTKIHGDPHVDENGDGKDEWHFGEDSTFILPDGTKICLDTEPNAGGEWLVSKVDVLGGEDRFHYDGKKPATMSQDAAEWDKSHADRSKDVSAGVFALSEGNQWAIQAADGQFYDVKNESWGQYQRDRDIEFGGPVAATTQDQRAMAMDRDLKGQGPGAPALGATHQGPKPGRKPGGRKANRNRRAQRRAAKKPHRGGRGGHRAARR